jgi:hypothetical protein
MTDERWSVNWKDAETMCIDDLANCHSMRNGHKSKTLCFREVDMTKKGIKFYSHEENKSLARVTTFGAMRSK